MSYLKGAPEVLLGRCTLSTEDRESWVEKADAYAREGFRVLAVAWAEGETEEQLSLLGLVLFWDPPRPEVPDAVATAQAAGIRVIMITGDHPATALAVAHLIGIPGVRVLTGEDLDECQGAALTEALGEVNVFARVRPEQKLQLVELLQAQGQIVAMTGDGVNDAPALKRSDVGVAMGQRGSDVSREVADLVLLDDNFATIVGAVEEGRAIYENIQKFLRFLFSTNLSEVLMVAAGSILAFAIDLRDNTGALMLPLTAAQILWINLMTDGVPALALAFDRTPGVMQQPPRPPNAPLLDRPSVRFVVAAGSMKAVLALGVLGLVPSFGYSLEVARAVAFHFMAVGQLLLTYPSRHTWMRPLPNRYLHAAVIVGVTIQVAAASLPVYIRPPRTGRHSAGTLGGGVRGRPARVGTGRGMFRPRVASTHAREGRPMIIPHIPTERLGPGWPRSEGLTASQALEARQRYGPNDIVEAVEHPWWALARDTARDPMIWFFAGTSALYGVVGQVAEAATLLGAIVPLVLMDVFLHRRTQASTEGLKSRLASRASVVRDGAPTDVAARDVVPGDLAIVVTGETFPADGLVLTGVDVQVDESSLTGESYPVRKRPVTAPSHAGDELRVGHEQWGFAGTRLLTGRATLRVAYTGGESIYGEIVRSAKGGAQTRTPLQQAIQGLVLALSAAALVLCAILIVVRLRQGHGWLDATISAVTLATAALPEEFPVVFAFFLGVGVYRLARSGALVRRAVSVENIGRVSCICSDKTGTITEGTLRLSHLVPDEGTDNARLLTVAVAASRRESGDPLDTAIFTRVDQEPFPGATMSERVATFPFTEDRKRETAIERDESGQILACTKGAAEVVLSLVPLSPADRQRWVDRVSALAESGHKVIGCAWRPLDGVWTGEEPVHDFRFAGLLAFEDPVRDGVTAAVSRVPIRGNSHHHRHRRSSGHCTRYCARDRAGRCGAGSHLGRADAGRHRFRPERNAARRPRHRSRGSCAEAGAGARAADARRDRRRDRRRRQRRAGTSSRGHRSRHGGARHTQRTRGRLHRLAR